MKQNFSIPKTAVLIALSAFILAWLSVNIRGFVSTQNGLIRTVLGTLFTILIIARPKPENRSQKTENRVPLLTAVFGLVISISGIVFEVHQFEWLGILLLFGGCLSWALPALYRKDICLSLLLFYWIHPLPGTIFGSMQIFMQKASVLISEIFLHTINIRVWADGLILRTGLNTYEIPAWCSGMRTATTVFILSFGLAVLKRLKWHQCIFIMLLSLAQALLLNVLRISSLVIAGPFAGDAANMDFLHDAAGIIIISAVILVWIEISLIQKYNHRSAENANTPNTRFLQNVSELPPSWRFILRNRGKIFFSISLLTFLSVGIFRNRPYHRAEMIKSVVEHMIAARDLANAERAADEVRSLVPKDKEHLMTIARIYVMREKYSEALKLIELIPDGDPTHNMDKKVQKAYAHMGLGDFRIAASIMDTIPDRIKLQNPMVAMIMAEVGMYSNNPEQTEKYLHIARTWEPNLPRVRRLYPYLRTHRKWAAISESDSLDLYHQSLNEALCAVDAHMHRNNSVAIASIAIDAMTRWPNDPRVLTPLFFMILKRDNPDWEERYSEHLRRCVKVMNDPDQLYALVENCFRIARPDLAWSIYAAIEQLDRTHPALDLMAVHYGHRWFLFRKQFLGMSAAGYNDLTDIRPVIAASKHLPHWTPIFKSIPLADKLKSYDHVTARKKFLPALTAEFERRKKLGNLSKAMILEYARISAVSDNISAAAELLSAPGSGLIDFEQKAYLSEIYENNGDWANVYEVLHDLPLEISEESPQRPPLLLLTRLCTAQAALRLGLMSLHTARKTYELYPESAGAIRVMARAVMEFDSAEECMRILNRDTPFFSRDIQLLRSHAMHKTQRYTAAKAVCEDLLAPSIPVTADTRQSIVLPPAEISLSYHRVSTPNAAAFEANAMQVRINSRAASTPFIRGLLANWLNIYESEKLPETKETLWEWAETGRTPAEKALAFHQLAMLMCHKHEFETARLAVREALRHLESSPILWRMLISLSDNRDEVIDIAREACPENSEIWLADVVSRVMIPESQTEKLPFTAESMTRAAEYLFRKGRFKDASLLSRQAVEKADSLLPAYIIGVRTALKDGDDKFAEKCVKGCIDSAVTPLPAFYETFVTLNTGIHSISTDPEMINALNGLRLQDPSNLAWAEMLGYIQFTRGGDAMIDAMHHLSSAMKLGSRKAFVYILAGETARQLGNLENSAAILTTGLQTHPNHKTMLNNLIFSLAQKDETAPEALKYIPQLKPLANKDPYIRDTIAVALLKNSLLDESERMLVDILSDYSHVKEHWFRSNMRLAEIAMLRSHTAKAESLLTEILKNTGGIRDEDVKSANRLAEQLEVLTGDQ